MRISDWSSDVFSSDLWFRAHRKQLLTGRKKVAMFCTGGIRCEKSTSFLRAEGIDEVYHLKGGILKYLEEMPENESLWQGECFVFAERVTWKTGQVGRASSRERRCKKVEL